MTPRLYLFVHGLTLFRQLGDWFQIILPRVEGHVYRAGGWLMETDIARRSELILRGVDTGQATLAGINMIRLPGYSLTSGARAATVLVPRPFEILGLLNAQPIGGGPIVSSTNPPLQFSPLATVLVLVYSFRSEQGVFLENHPWQPYAVQQSISLHLNAASEVPETKQHEMQTEAALAKLIRGYPDFKFARALQPDWRWTPSPLFGSLGDLKPVGDHFVTSTGQFAFKQAQLEHYAQRLQRLGLVGRFYQEHRSPDLAWTIPAPVGMETSNCVSYEL